MMVNTPSYRITVRQFASCEQSCIAEVARVRQADDSVRRRGQAVKLAVFQSGTQPRAPQRFSSGSMEYSK
jgi:hypothetical protein